MSREYRKREEENELIKRFEDHLRKRKTEFFDLDAYEEIIDFYMLRGKHNKACLLYTSTLPTTERV